MTDEVIEAVQQEEVPTNTEVQAATETPEVTETPETKPEPPKDEVPKGVQRRIDRAVRQKYEAEARAKMLEERLQALEQREQPKPTQRSDGAPRLEDFDNFEAFLDARDAFNAQRIKGETIAEYEARREAERAQAAQRQTADKWSKAISQTVKEIPDFEEVLAGSDVPMTPVMQQAIMDSDAGPKLAYYLATHEDDAERIAGLSPIAAIRELTRIEDKLTNQPVQVSKAPPPINPVGTKAKADKDPSEMNAEEFAKWRKGYIARRHA